MRIISLLQILIQSVMETMVPKLVAEDIPLLHSLLCDVFPGVKYSPAEMESLRREVKKVCQEMFLVYGEGDEQGVMWVEKVSCCFKVNGSTSGETSLANSFLLEQSLMEKIL